MGIGSIEQCDGHRVIVGARYVVTAIGGPFYVICDLISFDLDQDCSLAVQGLEGRPKMDIMDIWVFRETQG